MPERLEQSRQARGGADAAVELGRGQRRSGFFFPVGTGPCVENLVGSRGGLRRQTWENGLGRGGEEGNEGRAVIWGL